MSDPLLPPLKMTEEDLGVLSALEDSRNRLLAEGMHECPYKEDCPVIVTHDQLQGLVVPAPHHSVMSTGATPMEVTQDSFKRSYEDASPSPPSYNTRGASKKLKKVVTQPAGRTPPTRGRGPRIAAARSSSPTTESDPTRAYLEQLNQSMDSDLEGDRDSYALELAPKGAQYEISEQMLEFLRHPFYPPPEILKPEFDRWEQDSWNGLINPPPELHPDHFLWCVLHKETNSVKEKMRAKARAHLDVACATKWILNIPLADPNCSLPSKESQQNTDRLDPVKSLVDSLSKVVLEQKTIILEFERSCKICCAEMQKAASLAQGAATDSSNSLLASAMEITEKYKTKMASTLTQISSAPLPTSLVTNRPGVVPSSSPSQTSAPITRTRPPLPSVAELGPPRVLKAILPKKMEH